MKNSFFTTISIFLAALVLMLSIRGLPGTPNASQLASYMNKEDAPLELSPDKARYALIYSIVEENSFYLSLPLARFSTPDVAFLDGKYVSLFAPGTSIMAIPGYIVGSFLGSSLAGVFSTVAIFALLNLILISRIAHKLGASHQAGILGGFVFLFATPAFAYAMTLFQHHISVFLILSCLMLIITSKTVLSRIVVWILIGISFAVDYPNAFMMLPIAIFLIFEAININRDNNLLRVRINPARIAMVFFILLPFSLLTYYNVLAYGSPTRLAGTLTSVDVIDEKGNPTTNIEVNGKTINIFEENTVFKDTGLFFDTRNIINGFYIHFVSPDRGILFYTPIVLFSFIGFGVLKKSNPPIAALLLATALMNVLLYSMWGDPWGGWAFGSRYLIPTYAVAGIFLAFAITKLKKNAIFVLLLIPLLVYSVAVNTLGALTTIQIPPRIQVNELEEVSGKEEKYTFARGVDYLREHGTRSFFYNQVAGAIVTPLEYYLFVLSILILIFLMTFNKEIEVKTRHI